MDSNEHPTGLRRGARKAAGARKKTGNTDSGRKRGGGSVKPDRRAEEAKEVETDGPSRRAGRRSKAGGVKTSEKGKASQRKKSTAGKAASGKKTAAPAPAEESRKESGKRPAPSRTASPKASGVRKKGPARKKPAPVMAKAQQGKVDERMETRTEQGEASPRPSREVGESGMVRPDPSIEGRRRVIVEKVRPEIDGGLHPIKRVCGEQVTVQAAIFADGHELLAGRLLHRREGETSWQEVALTKLVNDRWEAAFRVLEIGWYEYTLVAWVDRFATWRQDLKKRAAAGQELDVELRIGASFVREAALAAEGTAVEDARLLHQVADSLAGAGPRTNGRDGANEKKRLTDALDPVLPALMERHAPRPFVTEYHKVGRVCVERERARCSTWYEMFPRSASPEPGRHGTFKDVEARLPYVAKMGFDILYLPPIHPIGRRFRKGRNNSVTGESGDPGSPWAIGGPEGGHKSIHPKLGTLEDFRGLVGQAKRHGMEIALDIAFQCSPDHPYVREHPDWFPKRPDGTIQYAENPPKKYQDIYPFHFDCDDWRNLWSELCSIFLFWIEQGVKVFRVDNPHTKPFKFWAWCIGEIRRLHPDVLFLSEAFTRPHPMYKLAKLGFSQSYTYFAWKNSKHELTEWWAETILEEPREYYRPNLWPNTPDILNAHLQHGGRPAFVSRLVLAATMAASYGIYGPAFELVEHAPREPGSEEYLNSEKYEIRTWDLDRPGSLRDLIALINKVRREHPALQTNECFAFHDTDNENLICYSKRTAERDDVIVTIVNLDPYHVQSGWIDLDLPELGIEPDKPFQAHDLITGARYLWNGSRNFVSLDPHAFPAHVLFMRRYLRTERDFDYFA